MSTIDGLARSLPRYPEATKLYESFRLGRAYRTGEMVAYDGYIWKAQRSTSRIPAESAYPSGNIGNSTYWQTTGEAYAISDTNVRLCTGNYQTNFVCTKESFTANTSGLEISAQVYMSGADFWYFGIRDASIAATSESFSGYSGIRNDCYGTNNIYVYDNGSAYAWIDTTTAGTYTWTLKWLPTSSTTCNLQVWRDSTYLGYYPTTKPAYTSYRIFCAANTGGVNGPFNTYGRPGGFNGNIDWLKYAVEI
jgi:hypothetical protein